MDGIWWVAAQLRAERAAADMTREALATKSGVSLSTIRRMEEAERAGTIDNLADLCTALDVPLSSFFQRAEQRREQGRGSATVTELPKRPAPAKQKTAARKNKEPDA